MNISIFRNFGAMNSYPVFDAFEKGAKRKGWKVSHHDENADVAVIWSVLWNGRMSMNKPVWEKFRKQNKPVIILEIGCINRGCLWKVGVNGVNGDGYFGPTGNDDKRRKLFNIVTWPRKEGCNIIICGQHPASEQWKNMPPMNVWIADQVKEIRKYSSRKIIIRPHPRAPKINYPQFPDTVVEWPSLVPRTYDSFNFFDTLSNAWTVVNWNSNPATIAALTGVPVFVGPNSYAAPVGNLDLSKIENPDFPDREQWANDLAYTEWHIDEIARGEPLDRLSSKIIV